MATNRLETRLTARDETARAFRTMQSNLGKVETAFANVAKVAGALGAVFAGAFVRDLVNVNKEFQSLKASLITFTGSVESADSAFKILQQFAKTTPFSLQEVVGSFNLLVSQGIKPTEAQLGSFADIAGGTSKSIMQFAEAVADASMNEFERLKEFGIKASKEGDKITLRMGDITKVVDNNSESIVQALTEIADVQFAGGAARQAATLGGAITNLRDNIDGFMFLIGEAGFGAALASSIKRLSEFVDGNQKVAEIISDKMTKGLLVFSAALELVFLNLDDIGNVLDVVFGVLVIKKILSVGNQIIKFTRSIIASQVALTALRIITANWKVALAAVAVGTAAATLATDEFKDSIKAQIAQFMDQIKFTNLVEGAMNTLGLEFLDVEAAAAEFRKESGNMTAQAVKTDVTLASLIPTVDGVSGALNTGTISTTEFQSAMEAMGKKIFPVENALSDLKDEKAALTEMVKAGIITFDDMETTLNTLAREALGLDTTMADLKTRQDIAEKAFRAGIITGDEYKNIISEIKGEIIDYNAENEKTFGAGAIQGVKDYYKSISDSAANMQTFVGTAFESLQSTLSDFFMTGNLNFGSFVDAIKRGLADLAAKAVVSVGLNFLGKVFPNLAFADGGLVPGSGGPRSDDVLARVSSGEYVIKASSVSKFGTGFFDALNAGQMPAGGGGGDGGGISIDSGIMDSLTPGFFLGGIIKAVTGIIKGVVNAIKNVIMGVINAVKSIVGAITNAVRGLVEGIMSGDLATLLAVASSFILPGVGGMIASNLASGSGFINAVVGGISESFAAGVLGGGSLASIATNVGVEAMKGAFTDKLSGSIATNILGVTNGMAAAGGQYERDRADRFATLYNRSAPYLAAMTGANVHGGDNVRVGERGPELFIPNQNGTIAPIKGAAGDLIGSINSMKEEIKSLRRDLGRVISGGQLVGARS